MNIKVELPQSEVNALVHAVHAWQIRKRAQIIALIEKTAEAIKDDAKELAPKKSHALEKSIRTDLKKIASELSASVIAGGTRKVYYQHFVEFGTSKRPAQPYLKPAYEKHIPGFIAELKRILS